MCTTKNNVEKALVLSTHYNLFHVKTLKYNDLHGVVKWLGLAQDLCENVGPHRDTVSALEDILSRSRLCGTVSVFSIDEPPDVTGKERVIMYVKNNSRLSSSSDSVLLFWVISNDVHAPYDGVVVDLMDSLHCKSGEQVRILFPQLQSLSADPQVKANKQQLAPVMDGALPSAYLTTRQRSPSFTVDPFSRVYKPMRSVAPQCQWSIYRNVKLLEQRYVDIEELLVARTKVLGRGGFGVAVSLDEQTVVKTNLFPEMVDWSIPFIDNEFTRYAHVASQTEEVMLGVSMKHPNILRTFGGLWCEIPDYQLGGRLILIMERAVMSLHEFVTRVKNTTVLPLVELDTLRGLEYLRSRAIQHRDLTHRNILVCHQPDRRPVPFAFKISDFGTSCNFSTPDQPRGNCTNMAPEVLWCMTSAVASDIFSWYCVMWELHAGYPLIEYRNVNAVDHSHRRSSYCRKTYATNLSALVGVYVPMALDSLKSKYMRAIGARDLYQKHKGRRPSVCTIQNSIEHMGRGLVDKYFIGMGSLCITLFPQERYTPSQLLSLSRYAVVSQQTTDVDVPTCSLPIAIRVGEFEPRDIIFSNDCKPNLDAFNSVPQKISPADTKHYFGVDYFRLAPYLIQPYSWYSDKVLRLKGIYEREYGRKGRASDHVHDKVMLNPSMAVHSVAAETQRKLTKTCQAQYGQWEEVLPVAGTAHTGSIDVSFKELGEVADHLTEACPANKYLGEIQREDVSGSRTTESKPGGLQDTFGSGQVAAQRETLFVSVHATLEKEAHDLGDSPMFSVCKTTEKLPCGTLCIKGKKIQGEMDTTIVILRSQCSFEIAWFKSNLVLLSEHMTEMHPLLFTGPRSGWLRCSECKEMFVFQYAQSFIGQRVAHEHAFSSVKYTREQLLSQVFVTLRLAQQNGVLPSCALDLNDFLTHDGAIMIDVVSYLGKHFRKTPGSLFGTESDHMPKFCKELFRIHLPDTALATWVTENSSVKTEDCLSYVIHHLESSTVTIERIMPDILNLKDCHFTFRDYTSDNSNWLSDDSLFSPDYRCSTKLLVFGRPTAVCGEQHLGRTALDKATIKSLVRSIMLRMRSRVFGLKRAEVTALDCTQGLLKIVLHNDALNNVPEIDVIDETCLIHDGDISYTHDAPNCLSSNLVPVIMVTKLRKQGPVDEFSFSFYKVLIIMVTLSMHGTLKTLKELFQGMTAFSTTEY